MATSAHPYMKNFDAKTQVIAHASLKVAQVGAMITPPIYLISSLILRRGNGFSVRRFMRYSTVGTVAGAGLGAFMGWGRLRDQTIVAIEDRQYRLAHSASQIRADDYSIMGATLGALLTPTILLKRAPFIGLVIGGASIGLGAGVWVHIAKMLQEGRKTKPEGMVGEIPIVGGNK